jgi:hypothetical protein
MSKTVSISPLVHAKMMTHAVQNPRSVVHGILIGTSSESSSSLTIVDALPVCHSTPTKPLLDMSLRLSEAYCLTNDDKLEIVGWYTAPEKDVDETPGPVALKIISSIAANSKVKDPVLVTITNTGMENFLQMEKSSDGDKMGFTVYGKDGKNHWVDEYEEGSINVSEGSWSSSNDAAVNVCLNDELKIFDFEDHMSGGSDSKSIKEKDWLRNGTIRKAVTEILAQQ